MPYALFKSTIFGKDYGSVKLQTKYLLFVFAVCTILRDCCRIVTNFQVTATRFESTTTQFVNEHLTIQASLAKWLSVCLQTKWSQVRIPLLSLKIQIWRLLRARSSLTFRQTIECRFTLKFVRDMIITYSHKNFQLITLAQETVCKICSSKSVNKVAIEQIKHLKHFQLSKLYLCSTCKSFSNFSCV